MRSLALCMILLVFAAKSTNAAKVTVLETPGGGIVPDAEVDDRGVVHLAYLANDNVYYVTSADQGQSFTPPIRVNSEEGFAYGAAFRGPDLAMGRDGQIHVVWYNAGYQQKRPQEDWGVMYSRLKADGSAFEPARNLNRRPSDNFSLAADDAGHVAVVWMAGGVYVSLSRDGGNSFAAPLELKTEPCECCGSRAEYLDDGTLSVLYRDKQDNYRDSCLALLARGARQPSHVKISQTPWFIAACPMTGSFLARASAGLVASWETKGQIYFARLTANGQLASNREIHVTDAGRYPVVRTAADGTTLVAWKDGTKLCWQLFDALDRPLDERGTLPGETSHRPAGVVTQDGKFLLFP